MVEPLTSTPVVWHVRCTYCFNGNALETKSPLSICRNCFDYLGPYDRRRLLAARRQEAPDAQT